MKRSFSLSFLALPLLVACDGGGMMITDKPDTTCDTAPAMVTMAQLQTEIFEGKCKSCHYPGVPPAPDGSGFAYGDYTSAAKTYEMVNKASVYKGTAGTLKIVDADMAKTTADRLANSTLWLKVSSKKALGFKGPKGETTGATMPQGLMPLSDIDQKKIKDWICRGAPM